MTKLREIYDTKLFREFINNQQDKNNSIVETVGKFNHILSKDFIMQNNGVQLGNIDNYIKEELNYKSRYIKEFKKLLKDTYIAIILIQIYLFTVYIIKSFTKDVSISASLPRLLLIVVLLIILYIIILVVWNYFKVRKHMNENKHKLLRYIDDLQNYNTNKVTPVQVMSCLSIDSYGETKIKVIEYKYKTSYGTRSTITNVDIITSLMINVINTYNYTLKDIIYIKEFKEFNSIKMVYINEVINKLFETLHVFGLYDEHYRNYTELYLKFMKDKGIIEDYSPLEMQTNNYTELVDDFYKQLVIGDLINNTKYSNKQQVKIVAENVRNYIDSVLIEFRNVGIDNNKYDLIMYEINDLTNGVDNLLIVVNNEQDKIVLKKLKGELEQLKKEID